MRQNLEIEARKLIVDLHLQADGQNLNEQISSRLGTQTQMMRSNYLMTSQRNIQTNSYEDLPKRGS